MSDQNQLPEKPADRKKTPVMGYALIIIGVIFLFERIFDWNVFHYLAWRYIWPVLLILLGIHLVMRKSRS